MTITIAPFWCGVIATLLIEFLAIIIYGIVNRKK